MIAVGLRGNGRRGKRMERAIASLPWAKAQTDRARIANPPVAARTQGRINDPRSGAQPDRAIASRHQTQSPAHVATAR
jgi:hypothetical protein